jgi:hypothetical protein
MIMNFELLWIKGAYAVSYPKFQYHKPEDLKSYMECAFVADELMAELGCWCAKI